MWGRAGLDIPRDSLLGRRNLGRRHNGWRSLNDPGHMGCFQASRIMAAKDCNGVGMDISVGGMVPRISLGPEEGSRAAG